MPIDKLTNEDGPADNFDDKDPIDWMNAESRVNSYKKMLKENKLGEMISFSLSQIAIKRLLSQSEGLDTVKFYLALDDNKAISAFAIASKLNPKTGEFDDFNIPETHPGDPKELPLIEKVRPCPHQCGDKNFLNTEI